MRRVYLAIASDRSRRFIRVGILMKDDQTSLLSAARLSDPVVQRVSAPRRPLLPAFLTGSTIFFVGAVLFAGKFAGANGAWKPPFDISAPVVEAPVRMPVADRPVHLRRKFTATATANARGGRAICVRLCDGFFFPSVITSGSDEACASQCPDAPTAFYSQPAGSDKIEDAVSLSGAPYSALAVADHHQLSFDNTCTCHRSFTRSYLADLLRDRTLRNGDLVMTANGFAVFRSDKSGAVSAANFVALSKSSSVPKNFRPELTAMERAGIWDRQSGPYSYSSADAVASSAAVVTAVTTTIAPRLRKGIVTVDDGDATR
jgi:hypothetical protein